ncbi:MAG TPA: nickel pincer cofactor biosynthesis protein LarB [Candidatus Sulfotelmatobacter sp.]|nr:nickel pincer cofactor biosynthesis protein LarB [Candidatus Sulfotelmatobacter sp.]
MQRSELRALLRRVRRGDVAPAAAARSIEGEPIERLAFATLDHQRTLRTGFAEVVFGQGKTPAQLVAIMGRLLSRSGVVLATRVDDAGRQALAGAFPNAEIHHRARCVVLRRRRVRAARRAVRNGVLVISAGTSDLPVAEEALITARTLGSPAELVADVGVAGLHRLLAHRERLRDARALVVVAGLEGALPSVVGGLTDRPLIAVPTSVGYGAHFKGLAPLLAMLNSCAAGVMVVNVDNGFGAGYAAHLIVRGARAR